ncbi:MAG: GNAT family N-acetyltransferase [Ferrimicrobium sp.]|uniref:GNAT family N-acetyltransferase n=1 Tax=Ferrimicrobium sp. TaxID=2926050 RepID=UPI00260B47B6|nr:GNAT family N-acetyltransferase [Ferrimicrobium sp.]
MMAVDEWQVIQPKEGNFELLQAINLLLPQLSQRAGSLTLERLDEVLAAPSSHLFVAVNRQGQIGAMLTLVVFPILTGQRAWVEDVVVDTSLRGKGLGRLLTQRALRAAEELGVATVDLTSRASRVAAHGLYESVGFVVRDTSVYRFVVEAS